MIIAKSQIDPPSLSCFTVLHRIILHGEKRERGGGGGIVEKAILPNWRTKEGGEYRCKSCLSILELVSYSNTLSPSVEREGEGEGTKKRIVRMNGIKRKKARPAFVNTARSAFKPICMTRRARPALSSYDLPRTEFR